MASTGAKVAGRRWTVWRLLDGKPGHQNQSLGLVRALAARVPLDVHDIPVREGWRGWLRLVAGLCPEGNGLPDPDLLIGAGHGTHAALLACRRARGGRSVVLMKPSLPRPWFDLCLIPEHDGVAPSDRVLVTRGVLNAVAPAANKDARLGMILVGGPSRHYGWDDDRLLEQVAAVASLDARRWILASSRRTPDGTLTKLRTLAAENLTIVPSSETEPAWLPRQLAYASAVWVTEDSVSMLYEALTSGAACGVLPVPAHRASGVQAGVQGLVDDGIVCTFDAWQAGATLATPREPFNEAGRCAQWMVDRWLAS